MLPSYLNLNIRKTRGCNNEILMSNTYMKTGSNGDVNKDRKKMLATPQDDTPKKIVIHAVQHDPVGAITSHNLKMLTKKYSNEKLAITLFIVGTGLIAYHFW